MEQTNEFGYRPKYAGFWIRFWAFLVDSIVVASLGGLIVKPIFRAMHWTIESPAWLLFTPFKVTMFVVFFTYFLVMTKWFGQTLGKMIFGIRVVMKDGTPVTWGAVIFRELFGRFISKMTYFPYLLAVVMPRKEALHDIFADTVVIHEEAYEVDRPVFVMNEPKIPEGYEERYD